MLTGCWWDDVLSLSLTTTLSKFVKLEDGVHSGQTLGVLLTVLRDKLLARGSHHGQALPVSCLELTAFCIWVLSTEVLPAPVQGLGPLVPQRCGAGVGHGGHPGT